MKVVNFEEQVKRSIVIEKLQKRGYTNVEGKSYRELKTILAVLDIKAESPHSTWF